MRAEAEVWWRQAEADLATASLLLELERHYAASWFAQQAGEKALEAGYLDRTGKLAQKTHDLEFLGSELSAPGEVEGELIRLNPAFDASRYPDPTGVIAPADRVDETTAAAHVEAAGRVTEWVRTQLL